MGLLSIAILKADGVYGISDWRWLFLLEGFITTIFAFVVAFILPNSIDSAKGLTQQEQDRLKWNFEQDIGQEDKPEEISGWQAATMAISDPKTWMLLSVLYMINGAVTQFFPSVVSTLGFSRNITCLLTAPPYLLRVVCVIAFGRHSDKVQEHFWHVVMPLSFAVVANIIAMSTRL